MPQKDPSRCRLLVSPQRWQQEVQLEEGEKRYLVGVHRLSPGATLEVFDGRGRSCLAILVRRQGKWGLLLGEEVSFEPRRCPVRLALALTKGQYLDTVVRMAGEIGVATIEPFLCRRAVPRPSAPEAEKRRRRWQAIAAEAARQSGQCWVSEVRPLVELEGLPLHAGDEIGVVLHPQAKEDARLIFSRCAGQPVLLLIGPEGGFSQEEVEAARARGFLLGRLNLPVLRAGTAAVVAAALACLDRFPALG